ncbi:2-(1,2-epoxy-1,2-dihydrophenyl)acetyl-CoA isomerase [Sphingobacteriales bacterium UPWRP_1]|nr:2-(1,2-epoxy-1,2-dihydrophenyl)acetyl-CoA isomerase [Sphingobacteriales bacterium TSM_CSS]PSJ76729.1 2-(1,2-epoxy-1,2-dihydrophenyl)acetyl-CoA isomerase [Sphingobacteriales bacterium UPWRP_1]
MYEHLLYHFENGVVLITLNRPDNFNAFVETMNGELADAVKKAAKDPDVKVLVLTGAGKAFCSGQDLKDIKDKIGQRNLGESVIQRYNPMIKAICNCPKPVVCRLNGVAAGAGCSLALACDMVIASEKAWLIEAFVHVGLVLDSGSSYFLPRLVGSKKAFEIAAMGTKIGAQEALQLGLVNRVVPPEELDAAVKEVTDYFVKAPAKAIAYIKKMLSMSLQADLDTMLQQEAYYQQLAGFSDDYKEGITAFIEKRPPAFTGK